MFYENIEYTLLRFFVIDFSCLSLLWYTPDNLFIFVLLICFILWIILFRKIAKSSVNRMVVSKVANYNCSIGKAKRFAYKIIGVIFVCIIILWWLLVVNSFSFSSCGDPECIECGAENALIVLVCIQMLLPKIIFFIFLLYYSLKISDISDIEIEEYNNKK